MHSWDFFKSCIECAILSLVISLLWHYEICSHKIKKEKDKNDFNMMRLWILYGVPIISTYGDNLDRG